MFETARQIESARSFDHQKRYGPNEAQEVPKPGGVFSRASNLIIERYQQFQQDLGSVRKSVSQMRAPIGDTNALAEYALNALALERAKLPDSQDQADLLNQNMRLAASRFGERMFTGLQGRNRESQVLQTDSLPELWQASPLFDTERSALRAFTSEIRKFI